MVAALDMEGHGRSSGVHGFVPSVTDAVADMAAFARKSRLEYPDLHCFLVGGSWGGQICLLAAEELKATGFEHFIDGISLQVRPPFTLLQLLSTPSQQTTTTTIPCGPQLSSREYCALDCH